NDDTQVTLAVSPSSVTEDGSSNLVYTFTRTGLISNALTVNYTVGGTATFNSDYTQREAASFTNTSGSITFAPGASTATFIIDPASDTVVEGNESVSISLTSGTGYTIGTTSAVTGSILDNDVTPGTVVRTPIAPASPDRTRYEVRNHSAFAALKSDGSVVTWGYSSSGGNSSSVASQLTSGVTQIFSTLNAFAALKSNGSVVTWGHSRWGGNSSSVASQLTSGVTQIFSTDYAFAAFKSDGSVVTWGDSSGGGDSSSVASQLTSGVTQIFSNDGAFAALKSNGSVVTWGDSSGGGDSSSVASQLTSGVTQIFSNDGAFAALKSNGSVVTWGHSRWGGNSSSVASQLTSGVTQIFSNDGAFAALKSNGSVVTWGDSSGGGDSSSVASQLTSGVTQIFSNDGAFAALKSNGSVVTWGDSSGGGNSSSVASQLTSGVTQIFSNDGAFAALKSNGSVVTWGDSSSGGDSSSVASQLTSDVTQIFSTSSYAYGAFAALKSNGSVVTWGDSSGGGDSSSIASQLSSGVVSFADPFNDDRLVPLSTITLAVNPTSVTEDGGSNLVYTFTRAEDTANTLTVNYTIGGTATNGSDYNNIGTSVTFAAGSSTATVTVDPTADNRVEANETVSLTLASGTGYTVTTTSAVTGTITNDDLISLINQTLNLLENQTATISQSQLSVTSTISPTNIRYTITDLPDYGKIMFLGAEIGVGDSFTQSAINNNRVSYQHGNHENNTADSITLTVTDGVSILENVTFNISVTLVDDPPILSKNQILSVNQGQVVTITKEILAATDVDT
ncbi:cadherin-like domain-containing protein, partial [Cylindrospermopsis raciborskii]|uniref:cadherin-like domain-containing protein n=1 Tax=Cylindrospermopsis raciborskii TaxID=77022 RepID=UPI000B0F706F